MAVLLDSYAETNHNAGILFTDTVSNGKDSLGQAISVTRACIVSSVKFYLSKYSTPLGTFVVKIYACDGTPGSTGKPTGSALGTSSAVSTTAIPTDPTYEWVEFVFTSPVALTIGNYCLSMEIATETSFDNYNYVFFSVDTSSPSHAGNLFTADDIGTWTAVSGQDACFQLYGGYPVATQAFIL